MNCGSKTTTISVRQATWHQRQSIETSAHMPQISGPSASFSSNCWQEVCHGLARPRNKSQNKWPKVIWNRPFTSQKLTKAQKHFWREFCVLTNSKEWSQNNYFITRCTTMIESFLNWPQWVLLAQNEIASTFCPLLLLKILVRKNGFLTIRD